jgi:hypothetical protein
MASTKYLIDENGRTVGTLVYRSGAPGWFFIPTTTARTPSRKGHKTPEAAVPAWAKGLGRIVDRESC